MKKSTSSKQHHDMANDQAIPKKDTINKHEASKEPTTLKPITSLTLIINYICRIHCSTKAHTKLMPELCQKGCGYLCNQCGENSSKLASVYVTNQTTLCYHHVLNMFKVVVHYFFGHDLILYNCLTSKKKVVTLDKCIDNYSSSISYNGRIFVMGGSLIVNGREQDELIGEVYEINIMTRKLIPKADMLTPICNHSLCILDKEIYSISGFDHRADKVCQKYSINHNKWNYLPNLHESRAGCAAFVYKSDVYALGGCDQKMTMEKWKKSQPIAWVYVKLSNKFTPRFNLQAIPINETTVLAFGGYGQKENRFRQESYLVDMNDDCVSCTEGSIMMEHKGFKNEAPVFDGENVYAIDTYKWIHIYSVNTKKWTIIDHKLQ